MDHQPPQRPPAARQRRPEEFITQIRAIPRFPDRINTDGVILKFCDRENDFGEVEEDQDEEHEYPAIPFHHNYRFDAIRRQDDELPIDEFGNMTERRTAWTYFGTIHWEQFSAQQCLTVADLKHHTNNRFEPEVYNNVIQADEEEDEKEKYTLARTIIFLDNVNRCIYYGTHWREGTLNEFSHIVFDGQRPWEKSTNYSLHNKYGTCKDCYACGPLGAICKRCKAQTPPTTNYFHLVSFNGDFDRRPPGLYARPAVPYFLGRITGYNEPGYDSHHNRLCELSALFHLLRMHPSILNHSTEDTLQMIQLGAPVHRGDPLRLFKGRLPRKNVADFETWHPLTVAQQLSPILKMSEQDVTTHWTAYMGQRFIDDRTYHLRSRLAVDPEDAHIPYGRDLHSMIASYNDGHSDDADEWEAMDRVHAG